MFKLLINISKLNEKKTLIKISYIMEFCTPVVPDKQPAQQQSKAVLKHTYTVNKNIFGLYFYNSFYAYYTDVTH